MRYVFRKKAYARIAGFVDAFGRLFFRYRQHAAPEPKTLLVVRLDHLGDVLGATGIPQALKGHHPSAKIIFLTSTAGKALLENNPYVDEVLVYDAPWFRRPGGAYEKTGFWKVVGELKKRRVDLGLSLRGDARENLLLFLAGVRFRVGYGITGLGFLLHRELSYREEAPEIQHSLDILRALGIHRDVLLPAVFFSDEEEARIKSLAAEGAGKTTVGVQLDAGSSAKSWPEANRSAFLDKVFKRFPDLRFLFFGADPAMASWLEKRL